MLSAPRGILIFAFLLSRAVYFAAGIRFDLHPLDYYFQLLDPALLRTRLLESIFYMHIQPPGYNFLIGLVLKLVPDSSAPAAFHFLYAATGLALCLGLYRLMRLFAISSPIALALTLLFTANPSTVLYENQLNYEYPMAALLCWAAVWLLEWFQTRKLVYMAAFQAAILALMLIRSIFHPLLYFVPLCLGLLAVAPPYRRQIVVTALPSFAIMMAICLKNLILFGSFGTSIWLGYQGALMTTYQLSEQQRQSIAPELSPIASLPPIARISEYAPHIQVPPPRGVPALDQLERSTGAPNINHPAYFQVQKLYAQDARVVFQHFPQVYFRALATAWFTYFLPTSDFPFFDRTRPKIQAFDRALSTVFAGQFRDATDRKALRRAYAEGDRLSLLLYTGTFLLVAIPLLWLWSAWQTLRLDTPRASTLAFLLFNVLFISVLSNMLSCFESNRYRFPLDPFHMVMAGLFVASMLGDFTPGRTAIGKRLAYALEEVKQ